MSERWGRAAGGRKDGLALWPIVWRGRERHIAFPPSRLGGERDLLGPDSVA